MRPGLSAIHNGWLKRLRSAGVKALEVAEQSSPPPPIWNLDQKPVGEAPGGRSIRDLGSSGGSNSVSADASVIVSSDALTRMGMSAIFPGREGEKSNFLEASDEIEDARRISIAFRFHSPCSSIMDRCSAWQSTVPEQFNAIAKALVENAPGLNGLIGLDFRLSGDQFWLTEVNPRYTASVEVLELASGRSVLNALQVNCTQLNAPPSSPGSSRKLSVTISEMNAAARVFPPVVGYQFLYA